jgi:hypothetical protein
MKHLAGLIFVLVIAFTTYTQADNRTAWLSSILNNSELSNSEQKNRLTKYNFGPLWTRVDNSVVFGFIGDNCQRLRIKIISATRLPSKPDTYTVTGKSMVKNVVRAFNGTIKVTNARVYKNPRTGLDQEYKEKIKENGVAVGEYHFSEDRNQTSTGIFDGVFVTYWYIGRDGRLKYDNVELDADGYLNNQFVGTWTSYRTKESKSANWGDYRIPLSGDLDMGAGEFSPDDKYLPYGWQSYRDAYSNNDKRARREEEKKWWK